MREDGSEFDKDLSQIIQLGDINGDLHTQHIVMVPFRLKK